MQIRRKMQLKIESRWNRKSAKLESSSPIGDLHSLNRLRASTLFHVREKLFNALLRPQFMYCDIIYSGASAIVPLPFQRAFNSWTGYVLDLKKIVHISQHSSRLLGCSLGTYFKLRTATFLFKIINFSVPLYLLSYTRLPLSQTELLIYQFSPITWDLITIFFRLILALCIL